MSGFPVNVYRFVAEERVDGVVCIFQRSPVAGSGAFSRAEHIASEAGSSLVGTIAGESLSQCVVKHHPHLIDTRIPEERAMQIRAPF